jgi:hypothetical protein
MMKYGDIIQFKPTSLVGRIICLIDRSPYSHTAIYLGRYASKNLIIESHPNTQGVRISVLQDWKNYIVLRAPTEPLPKSQLLGTIGAKYDFNRIYHLLKTKLLGGVLLNNGETELICSELADYCHNYTLGNKGVCTPATIDRLFIEGYLKEVNPKW